MKTSITLLCILPLLLLPNMAATYPLDGYSPYSCKLEEGFTCKKYQGNAKNYMNSVAIVESPAGAYRHFYLVTLLSNVVRKNSAVDHQTLATRIHRLIEKAHPLAQPASAGGRSSHPKAQ